VRRADSGTSPSRSRPEEEDDARAPYVSGWQERMRGGGGRAGRAGPSAELGCARAVLGRRAAAGVGPKGKGVRGKVKRVLFFFQFLLNTQTN
jgi:hypothetical protein